MNQFFYQIISRATKMIHLDDYRKRNITNETAFTRNRKLSFPVMIALTLNFLSRTMQIEIDDFFSNVLERKNDAPTKQAFFKARKKIKPDAFSELFQMTRDMIFENKKIKRYKDYRIFAIDGSEFRIDRTKENAELFKPRGNTSDNKSNAKISLLFDALSNYVIDAQIGSISTNEREYAKNNLEYFSTICDGNDIVIFDRGYPSKDLIATMSEMKCKYLMRLQDSTFKGIKDTQSNDFRINIKNGKNTYSARIVRVKLNSGETETLITNITEKEFKAEDFKTLYFYRWGIETVYDTLKNKLLAERFSGKSTVAVLQEYYAMMFILNCIAAMSATVERKLASTKAGCKYRYHTNVNLMIGYLKYRLSSMLLFKRKALDICRELIFLSMKQPVPVIKGRSAPRPIHSHQRKVFCPKYSI